MSFSLSSLLNPEPATAADPHRSPEQQRKSSLPSVQYVQSPEQHYATGPQQHGYGYPPATAQEAAQALASLATSNEPLSTHYYGYSAPDYAQQKAARRSSEHRSSSSHGAPIELPPPTSTSQRKPSSPTLEQYQVASRSPEQRRPSMISPVQPAFTLPPLQGFNSAQQEQPRRASVAQSPSLSHQSLHAQATTDGPSAFTNGPQAQAGDFSKKSSAAQLRETLNTSAMAMHMEGASSSPAQVKQEAIPTPRPSSPLEARRSSIQLDADSQTPKAIASLKSEHSMRNQSPLRESSVPMPSTEMAAPDSSNPKKRSAPSKTKKGTATAMKKAPPAKKRKVEPKRSETPASRSSKVPGFKADTSSKGTPANSSPAPSTRSFSAEAAADDEPYGDDADDDEDGEGDDDGDVYCICRKPDNGTFMIGCDGTCDDWFHGKCVGIEERDKNLIDKYMCPNCAKKGIGRTTWKRMCRRSGCRQPARVGGKSKGGKEGSKYCSEECGVLYFREMVARTRNREDTVKNRSSRRKGSVASSAERAALTEEDDLGAKGGVLAAGEVKSLMNSSKTADDFKKLGEGVLSPPATPDGKNDSSSSTTFPSTSYADSETKALEHISTQKEQARRRHGLLKNRMKFITMVKQAASRTATEKELKPKEYCGYDPRLEWTSAEFARWRDSKAGRQAFELETLAVESSVSGNATAKDSSEDTTMTNGVDGEDGGDFHDDAIYAQHAICDRKKCARHLEWGKLAVDDVRFEMSDNSDRMRALDEEEREIKERAGLRAKAGGEVVGVGRVEVHFAVGVEEVNGEVVEEEGEKDAAVDGEVEGMDVVAEHDEEGKPTADVAAELETAGLETELPPRQIQEQQAPPEPMAVDIAA